MASISTDANGNRTIQFRATDKRRRSVRLGAVPMKMANEIKIKVEALNAAAILQQLLPSPGSPAYGARLKCST